MLFSFGLLFIGGLLAGKFFNMLKLPSLIGMLLVGILLGPSMLQLLDDSLLAISSDLRELALVIILTRAGLNLDVSALKKVGRPAFLLCFVPACFEIVGTLLVAPILLDFTMMEALLLGTVLAAVSPAVVVPRMLKLMDNGYGSNKNIPQMVMAGGAVDDVFVIILFTATLSLLSTGSFDTSIFLTIPLSIVLGIGVGVVVGHLVIYFFHHFQVHDISKVLFLLSISFLLLTLEDYCTGIITFSALLSIMTMGVTINFKDNVLAKQLSVPFGSLWFVAEIWLFVLVGACVDIQLALNAGLVAFVLLVIIQLFRMLGVSVAVLKTNLNKKERLFVAFSYMPKATVQAAIGALPLAAGLDCGAMILTIAVLAILFTAPIGAILIDRLYPVLLEKGE